ncbi:cyanophycin synthetase [Sphingosinicella rhizophila]|uniref:Cyanophycin synthetase n=1 Tax=Sphingosinicella rhizophila TaxID=3050082 RepID=A0ABU3QBM6_9SPHN|nr:cyanophycin synthetase [Sphingosinicella sp. GR2756]MDT9600806.1 cyanophycin synthetase [Sphingosinicella sp. GR2756]
MKPIFFGAKSDAATRMMTACMAVTEAGVYRGPHYYSHRPMIRVQLDLGQLENWPSYLIPDFTDRLLALLPGLEGHGCSLGRRGGFVKRLREGTWLGHVVEHVALELQSMAGSPATRGKTRSVKGKPGVYNVMFAYDDEHVGLMAGRVAVELVASLLPQDLQGVTGLDRIWKLDGEYQFERRLADLKRLVRRNSLGPTTRALVDEARRRDIPVTRLDDRSLIQLGQGRYQQKIRASITGRTGLIATDTAGNKSLTKKLLDESGIPVPRGVAVRTAEDAVRQGLRLGFPLVTKPLDGNHGRGVTVGIMDEDQLRFGFAAAQAEAKCRDVLVERHFAGNDHRILVVDGRVIAVAERVPAQVVGNGVSNIRQLVAKVNQDPRRGDGHEKVMTRIKIDHLVEEFIGRAGLTPDSVPPAGQLVPLRATANLSTGGTAIDRTNEIHPDNAEIARRAAMIIGLDVAGVDFVCPDIGCSVLETGGGVIEVNAAPGLRMHIDPSEGPPRDVARPIIEMLFPAGRPSRIPIIAITGTNGKSTVARMTKHVLRYTGCTVGLTSTSGVYINDVLVHAGDATGPRSARMILRDPTVDVALLETARGGLLREGLAFDSADIGAVLNVAPDHLGLKGIETLEDLANVKSLIVETVRRRGTSILNADDPLTAKMAHRAGGRVIWFSLAGSDTSPMLRDHIDSGGRAVVREAGEDGGVIILYDEARREQIIKVGDIPATLLGMAEFNVANALAAIAICIAHEVPILTIRSALAQFRSTYEQNPGRLNVHDAHGYRVIVDYAHNAAGLTALGAVVRGLGRYHKRTIGVISIPGDRRDDDIREMGRIAGSIFDLLFFREDPGTRGRERGQIMGLLQEGALQFGHPPELIHMIAGEQEATAAALAAGEQGDLIVITPTEVEKCWRQVTEYQPGNLLHFPQAPQIAAE